MEGSLEKLCSKITCRETQIKTLYSLISSDSMPQSIFALGHTGTGKSLVIRSVLEFLGYNFAIVNCIENPTTKYLLERILNELWQNSSSVLEKSPKCSNVYEFIIHLKAFAAAHPSNIVVVFTNSSRLRDLESTLLPALLSLKELSKVNVCTIFTSDIVWEKFKIKNEMSEPVKIYFPQYTFEECREVLISLVEEEHVDVELYDSFLQYFLPLYYRFCRDLRELHYMAQLNYAKYTEPIEKGLCEKTDQRVLYRSAMPHLISNLEVLYLRISVDELQKKDELLKEIDSTYKLVHSFELPYHSKFMLCAAFLASYVPSKLDKKLFRVDSSKKKKRMADVKKTNSLMTALPHAFSLNRMLGIFCYIIGHPVDVNAVLLSQISTMCRLGLLMHVGLNKLDEMKYKCCIGIEFIHTIAKIIDFNIKDYLDAI